jgi:hypothetical protein
MSGFARFLPLSQRERSDESSVTTDRRAALAAVVESAADALTGTPDAAENAGRFVAGARLDRDATAEPGADPVAELRALAERVRTGGRRGDRALADAVRALLRVPATDAHPVALDPLTAGMVSLYAATSGPSDRRAVVRGRTVRATDAEWSFGAGPVLEATSREIAAFLLGVSDDPPHPVSARG